MSKKLKKTVPKLRFPEFEGDWESDYLNDIGEFKNGFNADKQAFGSGVEFINLMDIFGKSEIQKTYLERVEIPEKQLEQYKIRKGDVLFVRSSVKREGVGQSCLVNDDFEDTVYSGFIIRFREKINTLYPSYKKYCFAESSFRKEILSYATSSANTNINQDSLSQILLFYPSIAEQEKIASFLGAVDTRLNQLRRKRELLQTYKRGVMQKLFSQEVRFKDAIGSEFPDWEEKSLGEIAKIKRGASPRPISSPKWFSTQSNIGWVRISDVTKSNKYLEKTEQYLSEAGIEKSRFISSGNLIMSICATIGKPIITNIDVCIHDGFVIFEDLQASILFVYFLLESIELGWKKYGQPGIQLNLNTDIVSSEPVLLPCLEEQERIANFLTAIDRKIETISRQIEECDRFKQGLLQKLFV